MSGNPHLFDSARATLRSDGRFVYRDGYLHCDGSVAPLTNIYAIERRAPLRMV